MTTDANKNAYDDNDWFNQPAPPVESAACFFGDCARCPDPMRCPHQCHREMKLRLLADIDDSGRYTSLGVVRAAIFDVIDGGCKHDDDRLTHEWQFNNPNEDFANEQRETFVDTVCARIIQLQSPPFELDGELWKGLAKGEK